MAGLASSRRFGAPTSPLLSAPASSRFSSLPPAPLRYAQKNQLGVADFHSHSAKH
jgi:hypothetical protein